MARPALLLYYKLQGLHVAADSILHDRLALLAFVQTIPFSSAQVSDEPI